ncbi:maltooligosyl trehalose synthase [Pedococcus dokdonensis]|uniref:Maltooligosyl trehalose synthase n=1 Tax=Pedococcus dokdonensis TaxID=443156 RepID=A0A1H0QJ96_9MICO|nr:malto-oligosyltrehalose synthase [Pedococcus dokdonensis]SDP16738.1 maltooligosyl trehalose synthase [Pedococcus dokdonensis]
MSEPQPGLSGGATPHRPSSARAVPTATYRLQVQPAFTFSDAAAQADYLAALGVSHAYLSPVLAPAPGSTHGYDVVSHEFLNEEAGGAEGFDALSTALRDAGLRMVVDVVPNHMTTPTPASLNHPWWFVLRDGRESDHAHWFDVDWDAEDGRVLVPVLGQSLDAVLASGELAVEGGGGPHGDETVLRYFDHVFPVRPGTEGLDLPDLVAAQHYRLCDWREGGTRLNYRRFFDVTTLAAVRVEDPDVFHHTHRLLLEEFDAGTIDGFRIDHPDGLADPRGYLARLADATGDAWVVAEKILEGQEQLPDDWRCAGTTGYDTLLRVQQVFVDPAAEGPLTDLLTELVGQEQDLAELVRGAKEQVVEQVQAAEVNRLLRLLARIVPDEDQESLRRGLGALLVAMDRYRAYLVPGQPADHDQLQVLAHAEARAAAIAADADQDAVGIVALLAEGTPLHELDEAAEAVHREFMVRFQQTCGPVMAKGIEDTAFYRYARLTGLNEVGGDPGHLGLDPAGLHAFATRQLATWPTTMTTLSTHDTKRSEDVRARLSVVAELPGEWADWVRRTRELAAPHRGVNLDAATEYLLLQAAVGAWPIDTDRLQSYATKAIREAKQHTTWVDPDEAYEGDVAAFVAALTTEPALVSQLARWVDRASVAARETTLGQKLLQLVLPGVPDVYQGTELVDLSLVDPDNRRPVDYADRRDRLARLDAGEPPDDLAAEKLLVTSRALRLRRDHPEWFTGRHATYAAVPASTPHALAVGRGDEDGVQVVAVVTRLGEQLRRDGGWGSATLALPEGEWVDLLRDRPVGRHGDGTSALGDLLRDLPVALLVRHGSLGGHMNADPR